MAKKKFIRNPAFKEEPKEDNSSQEQNTETDANQQGGE